MKTIKTTLILIMLITSMLTAKAQDATNDATWEETISFINKYKKYITGFGYYAFELTGDYENKTLRFYNNDFEIVNLKLTTKFNERSFRAYLAFFDIKIKEINIDLKYLLKVETITGRYGDELKLILSNRKAAEIKYQLKQIKFDQQDTKDTRKNIIGNIESMNLRGKDFFILEFNKDDNMDARLIKAFKHLAFLATEKRKAARKALNEKF